MTDIHASKCARNFALWTLATYRSNESAKSASDDCSIESRNGKQFRKRTTGHVAELAHVKREHDWPHQYSGETRTTHNTEQRATTKGTMDNTTMAMSVLDCEYSNDKHNHSASSDRLPAPSIASEIDMIAERRRHWRHTPTVMAMLSGNTMSNCAEVEKIYRECQVTHSEDRICEVAAHYHSLCTLGYIPKD